MDPLPTHIHKRIIDKNYIDKHGKICIWNGKYIWNGKDGLEKWLNE